ncbi:hypothetical protein BV20DRAFT_1057249 [Pilatotrama ljubarskyi]|nr:hypothetical protein BV20DRAFT_1057249 [Pilatotrama ljubarskyi]
MATLHDLIIPWWPRTEWATGRDYMTQAQTKTLTSLAEDCGLDIAMFTQENGEGGRRLSKAEASKLITALLLGALPRQEEIEELGNNPPPKEFPHPRTWSTRNEDPTEKQTTWLADLITRLSVPDETIRDTLRTLTRGQASLLITALLKLREEGGYALSPEKRQASFEDAVEAVRAELPTGS